MTPGSLLPDAMFPIGPRVQRRRFIASPQLGHLPFIFLSLSWPMPGPTHDPYMSHLPILHRNFFMPQAIAFDSSHRTENCADDTNRDYLGNSQQRSRTSRNCPKRRRHAGGSVWRARRARGDVRGILDRRHMAGEQPELPEMQRVRKLERSCRLLRRTAHRAVAASRQVWRSRRSPIWTSPPSPDILLTTASTMASGSGQHPENDIASRGAGIRRYSPRARGPGSDFRAPRVPGRA